MMKKRNEDGYVLVYVLIVIFVVCSISVALMSYSLNTIRTQENMVQRMQDKYEAMGEIERVVAEISTRSVCVQAAIPDKTPLGAKTDCADTHYSSALLDLCSEITALSTAHISVTKVDSESAPSALAFSIATGSIEASVSVQTNFSASCYINFFEPDEHYHSYQLNVTDVVFDSYVIGGTSG